jgi:hypothetical protein
MTEWIAKIMEAVVSGALNALSKPGVLVGFINAWRTAMGPQQIIASKPNKDDDNFLRSAQVDGWVHDSVKP